MIAEGTNNGADIVAFAIGVMGGRAGKSKRSKAWSEKSRTWAAEWLANRLWGKAHQTVDLNIQPPGPRINYDALTPEELDAFDRLMAKAMGQAEPAPQLPGVVIDVAEDEP